MKKYLFLVFAALMAVGVSAQELANSTLFPNTFDYILPLSSGARESDTLRECEQLVVECLGHALMS
jgi:hypothetical protein